ncbi:MAG: ATP-binding protein [Proteobacteria bacterium]|nr:ATP-binding protein [Pseudomonadota bacterium]
MKIEKNHYNIGYVFNNVKSDYFNLLKKKELYLEVPKIKTILRFDFEKIKQVVSNIVGNAIKFADKNSSILVEFENTEDKFVITIFDKGVIIPSNELESIFDPFIQSSKTKTGTGGTGLGLSICRRIIEDHGGKIWAAENPNGAAIKFYLPKDAA